MKRETRRERESRIRTMAEESLKDHVILPGSVEGRWQVGRANRSSIYRVEVIVTYCNSLIIHGDLELVNFYSYCGEGGLRGPVRWVAESSSDYLASKASRGTGSEVAWSYEPEVALDDVMSYAEEGEKNPEDYRTFKDPDYPNLPPETWAERWRQIAEQIADGQHEHAVAQLIYDKIEDAEYCDSVGKCPSMRVLWAREVVRKLHSLLEQEEKHV